MTTKPDVSSPGGADVGLRTERRVAWLTPLIGGAAAIPALILHRWSWAAGLAIGATLAWLNFRWLRRGLDALVEASTAQAAAAKPQVPLASYAAAAGRYGLIALIVYVIFEVLKIPLLSMIVGLCSLGAATITASVYEILHPLE